MCVHTCVCVCVCVCVLGWLVISKSPGLRYGTLMEPGFGFMILFHIQQDSRFHSDLVVLLS